MFRFPLLILRTEDGSHVNAKGQSQTWNGIVSRDWPRIAKALDLRLGGALLKDIGDELGVSKERARQMVALGRAQLAFRVFKGLKRPP